GLRASTARRKTQNSSKSSARTDRRFSTAARSASSSWPSGSFSSVRRNIVRDLAGPAAARQSGGRTYRPAAKIRGQAFAHQVDEIVGVEAVDRALGQTGEAVVEALQRVAAAFDVGKVGGE